VFAVAPGAVAAPPGSPGMVRFVKGADSKFDAYTLRPSEARQAWMNSHYWRMRCYSPYFDSRLSWFPKAWVYKDLYAIYVGSDVAGRHPEWILKDASGNRLYIRYDCANGSCPQYAADVGDPGFRAAWLADARHLVQRGYRGLFVDDVNMFLSRVSDGRGQPVAPADPRTGHAMTEADWRRYIAEFTEAIRAAFPGTEIIHNPIWYAGHDDPFVQRELSSADLINLERGVNDKGLRGGDGPYGLRTFLAHIDWLHEHGIGVLFDGQANTDEEREYGLAAYFVVSSGRDALGNDAGGTPDDWWRGYDASLGEPRGSRYASSGVIRRDFRDGIVLLNEPESPRRTISLDGAYRDLGGKPRATVTLEAARGAVLMRGD